jgi:phosphohistidine phosphatase
VNLILWRHCEAAPGVPDDARPLTPRGVAQSQAMANWLLRQRAARGRILVSPAVRAQQTAQALSRDIETTEDVGTAGSVDTLLAAAGWPDAERDVLVVGHQPTLGRVASLLLDGDAQERFVAPGAILWLASRPGREAELKFALAPGA